MKFNNRFRCMTVATLSMSLSHLPQVMAAEALQTNHSKMISTTEILEQFNRKATQEKISAYLNHADIEKKLVAQGITAQEAQQRIASLSDAELQNLSQQIDKAQYGGDILVAILLVVLIIYLVKRI